MKKILLSCLLVCTFVDGAYVYASRSSASSRSKGGGEKLAKDLLRGLDENCSLLPSASSASYKGGEKSSIRTPGSLRDYLVDYLDILGKYQSTTDKKEQKRLASEKASMEKTLSLGGIIGGRGREAAYNGAIKTAVYLRKKYPKDDETFVKIYNCLEELRDELSGSKSRSTRKNASKLQGAPKSILDGVDNEFNHQGGVSEYFPKKDITSKRVGSLRLLAAAFKDYIDNYLEYRRNASTRKVTEPRVKAIEGLFGVSGPSDVFFSVLQAACVLADSLRDRIVDAKAERNGLGREDEDKDRYNKLTQEIEDADADLRYTKSLINNLRYFEPRIQTNSRSILG